MSQLSIENPYECIDWDSCQYIHSMSHQHSIGDVEECEAFYQMGYRHFAFSNYYPSEPVASLPAEFLRRYPDVIFTPNAEHHSFIDSGLHFNGLGSLFSSGYGQSVPISQLTTAPLTACFDGLHVYADSDHPRKSTYRLDIIIQARGEEQKEGVAAKLRIEGAVKSTFADGFAAEGELRDFPLTAGKHQFYMRAEKTAITATIAYEEKQFEIQQCRLMQGTNRPWREAFLAALDGERVDGQREGGLQYPEGGGITLNHPTADAAHYLPMLDFDPRVLGIEVWNYRRGFGSPLHFYQVWDEILRTGRRCWGFFVKDHRAFERGRNILILPDLAKLTPEERERAALSAYRSGAFFGSVAAPSTNAAGEMIAPFDKSDFRFTRIAVRRDDDGCLLALEVSVAGQGTAKYANIQLRFITAKGVELVVDGLVAKFPLDKKRAELLAHRFARVEAFAYPDTYSGGGVLTKEKIKQMDVAEIAALQSEAPACNSDVFPDSAPVPKTETVSPWNVIGSPPQSRKAVPVVDMIFSQPLRILPLP